MLRIAWRIMNFSLPKTIGVLSRTPAILRAQLQGLPDEWTRRIYGQNTWSVHEIVGHLIWGERTDWIVRLRHILTVGENEAFEKFDRDGHQSLCANSETDELLDMFEILRQKNIADLQELSLNDIDLQKSGMHPALGKVTASQLLATWTVHDLNHISQISKAMAYQYKDAVGPWDAYLSILSPPDPR